MALAGRCGPQPQRRAGVAAGVGRERAGQRRPTAAAHLWPATQSSILAALANAVVLLVAVGGSPGRRCTGSPPRAAAGGTVIIVAAIGIVINGITALCSWRGRKDDLNIRGAFLHMAADAGYRSGSCSRGSAILLTGWLWLDPVVSLPSRRSSWSGTWGLLRDSVNLALDAVPEGIDMRGASGLSRRLPEVAEVHDLHVWAMSTTETALTAHLVMPGGHPGDAFLAQICNDLHARFGIGHATTQVEVDPSHPCALAPDTVV